MNRRIPQSKAATGAKKRSLSTERMSVQMKSNLFSAVLLSAVLPFAAFAQAPAAAPAASKAETKTEAKTESADKGAVKTEKKSTHKKSEKKAAPRHTAAKRPSQKTPAAQ
jgi:hypothetical protein